MGMSNLVNDFASLVFASPRRDNRGPRRAHRWQRAFLCLVSCSVLLVANGCSWVPLWPGGDADGPLIDGKTASPEQVATVIEATRAKAQLAPQEPYWPFRMGELYAAVDSTSQAVTHLQKALDIDTAYAPAVALLSKIYYEAELYEDAIVMLEDFLTRNPDAPDAVRAALALHLEAVGDVDTAQAVLAQCSGNSKEVRATRTFVSLRDDDLQAALASAKQALDDNGNSAANHNNYGVALLWAGRPDDARRAFKNALKLDDKLPGALYNMAIVEAFYFFDEEKGRKWFARYRKYASDDPDNLASVLGTDLSKRLEATD